MSRTRSIMATAAVAALVLLATACGSTGAKASSPDGTIGTATTGTIRLGYFPNVTHATPIVGVENGIFQEKLGDTELETSLFNAGPAAVEALFAGAIDAAYVGPNPAINAWSKSNGDAIRIVSGATSGGALLVVQPGINSAADLKGRKVASPQLGGTQDVALRWWLHDGGLKTNSDGGGDVSIVPQESAQTLTSFKDGSIAGAWVPEPWATRLVQEGGGKVLVDEKSLWSDGQFVTTQLIVSTDFLNKYPGTVRALVEGQVAANAFVNANPAGARTIVNAAITKYTGKGIAPAVIDAAWNNLTFTNDPIPASLRTSADHAIAVGLLEPTNLEGIYDLRILNEVLKAQGLAPINE
jgi:NitT/TauT family transport system substrate-binding protein